MRLVKKMLLYAVRVQIMRQDLSSVIRILSDMRGISDSAPSTCSITPLYYLTTTEPMLEGAQLQRGLKEVGRALGCTLEAFFVYIIYAMVIYRKIRSC